jgi:hypothetical protein
MSVAIGERITAMTAPTGVTSWQMLTGVAPGRLKEARLNAHYALQWLARSARAFIPARPDDGHTNLGWDGTFGGFTTHPLPDGSQIALRLAPLGLVLLRDGKQEGSFDLAGRRERDVRDWLGAAATAKGWDAHRLDKPLPYDMPPHAIGQGGAYASGLDTALAELVQWFANAAVALETARARMIALGIDAPPVRCWPHHFDLDSLVSFGAGRSSGLGFEPGDDYYDEPYFYVSLYPAPDVAALPKLPAIGHWHSHHFTAAIATASAILPAGDRAAAVDAFLRAAVEVAVKTLR